MKILSDILDSLFDPDVRPMALGGVIAWLSYLFLIGAVAFL